MSLSPTLAMSSYTSECILILTSSTQLYGALLVGSEMQFCALCYSSSGSFFHVASTFEVVIISKHSSRIDQFELTIV